MDGGERAADTSIRIFLRPVGSALPLGFFAFAIGMLLLGTQALGWIPVREAKDVGLLLGAFVFPLELLATVIAFLARETLGATVLGIFTTSWLAIGLEGLRAAPGTRSDALAVYLFGLAAVVLLFAAVSSTGNLLFTALLSCATVRAVLSGLYEAGGSRSVERVSGGFGVGLAALAIYGGAPPPPP